MPNSEKSFYEITRAKNEIGDDIISLAVFDCPSTIGIEEAIERYKNGAVILSKSLGGEIIDPSKIIIAKMGLSCCLNGAEHAIDSKWHQDLNIKGGAIQDKITFRFKLNNQLGVETPSCYLFFDIRGHIVGEYFIKIPPEFI